MKTLVKNISFYFSTLCFAFLFCSSSVLLAQNEEFSPLVAVDDYFSFVNDELLEFNVLLNDGCAYPESIECEDVLIDISIERFYTTRKRRNSIRRRLFYLFPK